MEAPKDLGTFFNETRHNAQEYLELKSEWLRLHAIRAIAKATGVVMQLLITSSVLFLALIFIGLTAGFWLAQRTGSYAVGFGLVSLLLLLLAGLIYYFRDAIFINPVIRTLIQKMDHKEEPEKNETE